MLEFRRLGICLGIAAAFCMAACDDDSGSDKGKSGGDDNKAAACESNDDCKDVEGKPFCDPDKKECVEEKKDDDQGGETDDGKCKSDSDCTDSAKPKCDTASGECKAEENGGEGGSGEGEGGGSGEEGTGEGEQKSCASTETLCGEDCIETTSDKDHCGNCDTKCENEQVCVNGQCKKECQPGEEACGDACVDLMASKDHCGKCDSACKEGEACVSGECKKECAPGTEACGTECINLDDAATCGTCESHPACDTSKGEACNNRKCESMCTKEGETYCNEKCVNFKTDRDNCGGCGDEFKCAEDQKCNGGKCGTDCGEKTDCNGNCIDPKTDSNFCGATADTCENYQVCGEGLSCQDGKCICANAGESVCNISETESICTDPKTSLNYCGCGEEREGGAGVNCAALAGISESKCNDGKCEVTCDATHDDCDKDVSNGCEADLTSKDSCGACGVKCDDPNAKEASCSNGVCQYVCKDGMKACDVNGSVACKDVLNDNDNCGWCGNKCGSDSKCSDGFCVIPPENCDDDGYVTTKIENASGNEVEVRAYCIYTKDQLQAMRDRINGKKGTGAADRKYPDSNNTQNAYILMQPIDLGTQTWEPIGKPDSLNFSGVFLGNGQKITGSISLSSSNHGTTHSAGFFGDVVSGTIHGMNLDLKVTPTNCNENIGILSGRVRGTSFLIHNRVKGSLSLGNSLDVGILIGSLQGTTAIKQAEVSATLKAGGRAGGLIGTCEGSKGTIVDAEVEITQSSVSNSWPYGLGGLIGYVANEVTIQNAITKGTITDGGIAIDGVGGLVGRMDKPVAISDSSSSVKISASSSQNVGGGVGSAMNAVLKMSNSYATGEITGSQRVAGLVGFSGNSSLANCGTIVKSYATGNVIAKSSSDWNDNGGLIGVLYCGAVQDSYATGNVTTEAAPDGGLIGWLGKGEIQNCYATGNVTSGQSGQKVGGLIGYATSGPKIVQVYATGNVKGGTMVGGLIGNMASGEMTYCAATGNVENVSSLMSEGSQAGGLIGQMNSATVINCMALGDVTGKSAIGSVLGYAAGAITIRNTIGVGKVSGSTYAGGFVGRYDGSSGQSLVLKKDYYWEKAATSALGANSATATDPSVFPFKYNDEKEAVPSFSPNSKFDKTLGDTDWVNMKCKLSAGPKEEVTIPVLKVLSSQVCAQ